MSFATKHNSKVNLFNYEIPETHQFTTLKELFEDNGEKQVYKVNLIYTNTKGMFGKQPVVATDSELVNLPHYMMKLVEEIYSDGESVSLINSGNVGFKIYTYENKYGMNYTIEWVDIDDDIPF